MRADRLISILMYLQAEGKVTAMELARRLEVSERTIYRDIDALSGSGVPLYTDAGVGGGISLPPDYRTKIDGLTTPEIHALFMHITEKPMLQLGIGASLRSALLKLLNGLSQHNRQDAEWIHDRVYLDTENWRINKEDMEYTRIVQQAIWDEKWAMMEYTTRSGQRFSRPVKPYGLVAKTGIWFMVGEVQGTTKAFRISRIHSFEIREKSFVRPVNFSLQEFWQEWISHYEWVRTQYSVLLEVAQEGLPRLAQLMGEAVKQQAAQQLSELKPDWMRIELTFENEAAALSCIFGLGLQAEVIEPAELRCKIREHAAELARFYS